MDYFHGGIHGVIVSQYWVENVGSELAVEKRLVEHGATEDQWGSGEHVVSHGQLEHCLCARKVSESLEDLYQWRVDLRDLGAAQRQSNDNLWPLLGDKPTDHSAAVLAHQHDLVETDSVDEPDDRVDVAPNGKRRLFGGLRLARPGKIEDIPGVAIEMRNNIPPRVSVERPAMHKQQVGARSELLVADVGVANVDELTSAIGDVHVDDGTKTVTAGRLPVDVSACALAVPYDQSMSTSSRERVFAALLKYWRAHRGMSQLDLSLAAEVSARHISFLETGRSNPSPEMVLVLAQALDVPMRDTNELLRAAGFGTRYAEPSVEELLLGPLGDAVDTMLNHHEPFPMMVVDRLYNVIRTNRSGRQLFALADVDLDAVEPGEVNVLRLLFDPASREMIGDWEQAACTILRRLQREAFHRPNDQSMGELLDDLLKTPGIPDDWRNHDLAALEEPMLGVQFRAGDLSLNFLTTITEFNAPQNVTLEELRIESYFPLDDETRALCATLLV